jgi:hypothetical protein
MVLSQERKLLKSLQYKLFIMNTIHPHSDAQP